MTHSSNRLVALGVLGAALFAVPALAEEPAPKAATPAPAGEKPPGHPERGKDHAADKSEKAALRAEAKADKAADKADKAADKAERAEDRREFRSALGDLREDLKSGKITKQELKDRLAKLKETLPDRRREHREAIKRRWGATLAQPAVKNELTIHARRLAQLNRALLLAESERQGKDKDKLVDRIEKLIDKENERHEKAMDRFKSGPTDPTAAGETVKTGATPGGTAATGTAAVTGTAATRPAPAAAPPAPAQAKGGTP
jgi:hypothetical protein